MRPANNNQLDDTARYRTGSQCEALNE